MKYFWFGLLLLGISNAYYNYLKGYIALTAVSIILSIIILIDLVIKITQEEGE